jgi:outer membrane lipoprotein-sorting protein
MTTGIERAAVLLLALLFAVPGATAAAEQTRPAWGIEQLMESLRQVKSAKAKFVERKHLAVLSAPLELYGTLIYKAPSHLEKHTLRPRPESLILEGDRLTIEKTEGGPRRSFVLQEYPVLWAFVESIRSTLAGDVETLNRFYRVELSGKESRWRLMLKPREPKMRDVVTEIRIDGSGNWITAISVFEAGGDRSTMTITRDAP